MSPVRHQLASAAFPRHWIGVEKGWQTDGKKLSEALIEIEPADLTTHALFLGATGSGKTNCLHHVLAGEVLRGHSFIIVDPRGDLVTAAIELLDGWVEPEKVVLLDFREKQRPTGFDPLSGSGEPYFKALNVLDAVARESESWGVQLSETLRLALTALAESGHRLTDLESLFYNPELRAEVLAGTTSESARAFFERFDGLSTEKQATLAMPVLNKVSVLLSTPALRRILGHPNPVDLAKHLNTPGSVLLVSLAVDELHSAAHMMGSIFLSAVCREVFARISIPEHERNPLHLFVDEFEHFPDYDFEAILAEGRRFRLGLIVAHQTLGQLSTRMKGMILGNCGLKCVFRLGREDAATMSRDFFNDAKAFDFADMPMGHAVLWRRNQTPKVVEVNAPLLQTGAVSREGKAFRDLILSRNQVAEVTRPVILPSPPAHLRPPQPVESAPRKPARTTHSPKARQEPSVPVEHVIQFDPPAVEDWLTP